MNFFVTARRWQKGGKRYSQNQNERGRGRGRCRGRGSGRNIIYNLSFKAN